MEAGQKQSSYVEDPETLWSFTDIKKITLELKDIRRKHCVEISFKFLLHQYREMKKRAFKTFLFRWKFERLNLFLLGLYLEDSF